MSKRKKGKEENSKNRGGMDKDTLKRLIKGIFNDNPGKTYNYKQVCGMLMVNGASERKLVAQLLHNLATKEEIQEVYTGKYRQAEATGQITGKVEIAPGGYGFVVNEEKGEPVFVSQNNLNHALNGDTVKVKLYAKKKSRGPEGEVTEIIQRVRETFVGVMEVSSRFAFLVADSKHMPYDIFITPDKLNGAKDGQKAIVRITDWPKKARNPFGEVVEVLGNQGDNDTEMHAILAEFGLPYRFSSEIEALAGQISDEITKKEIADRRDFRHIPTITIDPEDAKDFDDALSLCPLENGNWEIGVHIADVTHYVKENNRLDEEALERGTSVYLVDRTIPMLPEKLSNHICSLRPNEDKLCFSAVFQLDNEAQLKNEWFGRTIINSNRRFSYHEAQMVIDTGEGDMKEEVTTLHMLAQKIRQERFKSGSISFERDEVKFEIDEKGKPVRVYFKPYGTANELVEEFMLLANKRVANLIGNTQNKNQHKTFVYRIHDKPNLEKLTRFADLIGKFGHRINMGSNKKIADSLNKVLADVKGKKEQDLVENLALRSMAKAVYSTNNIGHYGLGFSHYTHFTSPIRRYPDMMVHRLLDFYLRGETSKDKKRYESMCKHSSDRESLATEAERASVKYKQVEYMSERVGQVFDGIITGVTEWGIYVEVVENTCEGMVHIRNLTDDFYEYDEDNFCINGKHTGRRFQLGDPVKIKVQRVNMLKKQIDYLLADTPTN